MKIQTPAIVMIAVTSLCLFGCEESSSPEEPSLPEVTVATPISKKITDWDQFTGRLAAVKEVDMRARVSGYLQSVNFREGGMVNKGDLLFVIDPRPYAAVLRQAQAQLSRAKVRLELESLNLKRAESLRKQSAIAQEQLDTRTEEKNDAVAALEAAQATVESARLNVEFTHIKAPISGRIGRALVTEGNLVSGGSANSTPLTSIVSLDPIYFYFTGTERDYLRYLRLDKAGGRPSSRDSPNPARLRLADEEEFVHDGQMDFVDNRIDDATGAMQGRAVFDNPDLLLTPGMFAEIQLLGEGPYNALLIPDIAIMVDQAQQFVYVLDAENVARRRLVETGELNGELRIIREGLDKGDRVVVTGIQRVQHGSPVAPVSADRAADSKPRVTSEPV